MPFIYDEDKALLKVDDSQFAKGSKTGLLENYEASRDNLRAVDNSDANFNNLKSNYDEIVTYLQEEGHTNFQNPLDVNLEDLAKFPAATTTLPIVTSEAAKAYKYYSPSQDVFWTELAKLYDENPKIRVNLEKRGLGSKDDLINKSLEGARKTFENYADVSSRRTGWGVVGDILGTVKAFTEDPLMVLTSPASFAYNVPKAIIPAVAKTASREAIIAGTTEAAVQFGFASGYREKAGLPNEIEILGKKVPISVVNTTLATVGGGVLAGSFMGLGKGTPLAIQKFRKEFNKLPDFKVLQVFEKLKIKNPVELSTEDSTVFQSPFKDDLKNNKIFNQEVKQAEEAIAFEEKIPLKTTEAEPSKQSLEEIPVKYELVDPDQIDFDPVNFQYKTRGDEKGITDKLKGITTWDQPSSGTVMIYEFANGKRAIVDGHQRLGLAKRLKTDATGNKIMLQSIVFREIDGVSPKAAKYKGLISNLSNNTGTPEDAATVLRSEYGVNWEKIKATLPPRTSLVQNTQGLIKLSDEAWGMVRNGKYNVKLAARIGAVIEDKDLHAKVLQQLSGKKFNSLTELNLTLNQINTLPKTITKQETLFGEEFFAESLFVERSKLLNWAAKNLKQKSLAFKSIVQNEDTLAGAGNKLNKEGNLDEKTKYDIILGRLESVALTPGQLSDDLTRAAQLLKNGDKAAAEQSLLDSIEVAAREGTFNKLEFSGPARAVEAEDARQALAETQPKEKIVLYDKVEESNSSITNDLFGDESLKSIKSLVDNGKEVNTVPAANLRSGSQVVPVQRTETSLSSTVFAKDTAEPPSFLGDTTKVVGDTNSINNGRIYHKFNNYNDIVNAANEALPELNKVLDFFKKKYGAIISSNLKEASKLKRKLNLTSLGIESISDVVRGRISVKSVKEMFDVIDELKQNLKVIEVDNFIKEGRNGYRAVHIQVLNKNGLSAEIQIRHKDLDGLAGQAHKVRDQLKTATPTTKEVSDLIRKQKELEKQMNNKWNEIREKEYFNRESADNLDRVVADGLDFADDGTSKLVYQNNKESLQEISEIDNLLERLKDCK